LYLLIQLFLWCHAGKKFDAADLPAEQQPVFSISPDKLLLGPKEITSFLISGVSQAAGAPG
jgi:hydrocephalus-inducing protein